MPEYVMPHANAPTFVALDSFTQGYIEALFFTETEPGTTREDRVTTRGTVRKTWERRATEGQIHDMPADYGPQDLAQEALAQIVADCTAFQASQSAVLQEAYDRDYDEEQAGRDFWFTRNGHGVGYWDRKQLEPDSAEYEALTDAMIAARDDRQAWGEALAKRNALKAESIGERLSEAARDVGGLDAYIGDDGKVYLS